VRKFGGASVPPAKALVKTMSGAAKLVKTSSSPVLTSVTVDVRMSKRERRAEETLGGAARRHSELQGKRPWWTF